MNGKAGESPDERQQSWLRSLLAEWRNLSVGEIAFLAPLAIALVVLLVIEPKGPEAVIPGTLVIGLLAGAGIAVIRRRRARDEVTR